MSKHNYLKIAIKALIVPAFLASAILGTSGSIQASTITITGYEHGACEVHDESGTRKLIYPQYRGFGGQNEYPVSEDGYWNCETRLKAGIINCEQANKPATPITGVSDVAIESCAILFQSWVPECRAHYEQQFHKCEESQTASTNPDTERECEDCPSIVALSGSYEGYGQYYYPNNQNPPVPFEIIISIRDGRITGNTKEPNTFGDPSSSYLYANITGLITGESVSMTKTYNGVASVSHSVSYRGTLDHASKLISGTWSVGDLSGKYEIQL